MPHGFLHSQNQARLTLCPCGQSTAAMLNQFYQLELEELCYNLRMLERTIGDSRDFKQQKLHKHINMSERERLGILEYSEADRKT